MLANYAEAFFLLGRAIAGARQIARLHNVRRPGGVLPAIDKILERMGLDASFPQYDATEFAKDVSVALKSFPAAAEQMGMSLVVSQLERIQRLIEGNSYDFDDLGESLAELDNRLQDVLATEWFFHVKPALVKYYNNDALFGNEVDLKFGAAAEDIEDAGRCLALGQDTACVFHLMRAMECAVGALAARLSIPSPDREWGKLLSDIHAKVEQMPKGPQRDLWSECHANLYHVKQAWRNKTMHPKATYTPEQSAEVFQATKIFMAHLATLL